MEPGFDKRLAADQHSALPFAMKQSSGPQLGAKAMQQARRQAVPLVPSRASRAEAKASSEDKLNSADMVQAAAQAAPQSEQDVEKGFETTLSASDEAATHVSKKELQQMMDKMSASMASISAKSVHVSLKPVTSAPDALKFAKRQAGNSLLSPALSEVASKQAKPIVVKTTAAADQARALTLSRQASALAQRQALDSISPSALSTAKNQADTPFVLTTNNELQAARQSVQALGSSDKTKAKLQSQGLQLQASARQSAVLQASQTSLPLQSRLKAREQANVPQFDHSAREQARQQAQMVALTKGTAQEAQAQGNNFPLRTQDEVSAYRQASQHLGSETEAIAKKQAQGLNLHADQAKAAAQLAQAPKVPNALATATRQAESSPMSKSSAMSAQNQASTPVLTTVEQQASLVQALSPALVSRKEQFAYQQQASSGLSAHDKHLAYSQSQVGSKSLISKDLGEASHQAHANQINTEDKLYAAQQSHAVHVAGAAAAAAAQARLALNTKDKQAAAAQAKQTLSAQSQSTAAMQAEDKLSMHEEIGAMVQAAAPEMSHSENIAAQNQASGAKYANTVKQEALAQTKDAPTVQEMLTAANQVEVKVRKSDQIKAQQQSQEDSISNEDRVSAWKQAHLVQSSAALQQAQQQAAAPNQDPQTNLFAKQQAQGQRYDTQTAVKAWQQSSDHLHKKDAMQAKDQAHLSESAGNMALAKKQADQMFGAASKQAVDTNSQLTIEKRLVAVRQTDDSLKKKDAKTASVQASDLKLTSSESKFSKDQVTYLSMQCDLHMMCAPRCLTAKYRDYERKTHAMQLSKLKAILQEI